MAVKGKSKSGAAPGAPKPRIEPRKTPLSKRPAFRRTVAVLAVFVLTFIALSVWGRVSRANDLRAFDRKLSSALRPFQKHNEAGAPTNIGEVVPQIAGGQAPPAQVKELAATWEKDFVAARDAVGKLDPPQELELAKTVFAEAMDDYVGMARLALSLAEAQELAAKVKGKELKAQADGHVTNLQTSLQEWQARAEKRRGQAQAAVNELKADWGLGAAAA